ncbi:LytTR family DNA-binding domain-containing protein [Pedobacter gandavensis]|uniref:LytR/AlgR family response regulator transcription factor n=1 Tax=Pedobacter gandavensis TaxID=2679963 RepID=UPI00292D2C1C|nr:LytTR family DNA-binding domain-containing protein [Pedobacter gandavensis]
MELKSFLRQSYPIPDQQSRTALVIGIGIGLLMLLLKPYGLSNVEVRHDRLFLAGYGLVSFLVLFFNGTVVIRLFSETNWNIIRQIIWSCWSVFCLGLANYAYTLAVVDDFPFRISILLTFQLYTFFIAVIPLTILVLIRQNRLLRLNKNTAEVLNEQLIPTRHSGLLPEMLELSAGNSKGHLSIPVREIAFIESEGNYVQVYHSRNGSITPTMIRSSIAKVENEMIGLNQLIKCHRAFIVNIDFIEELKGNAQGYRLRIKGSDLEVHVSRQYTKVIKEAIKSCFSSQNHAVHP